MAEGRHVPGDESYLGLLVRAVGVARQFQHLNGLESAFWVHEPDAHDARLGERHLYLDGVGPRPAEGVGDDERDSLAGCVDRAGDAAEPRVE